MKILHKVLNYNITNREAQNHLLQIQLEEIFGKLFGTNLVCFFAGFLTNGTHKSLATLQYVVLASLMLILLRAYQWVIVNHYQFEASRPKSQPHTNNYSNPSPMPTTSITSHNHLQPLKHPSIFPPTFCFRAHKNQTSKHLWCTFRKMNSNHLNSLTPPFNPPTDNFPNPLSFVFRSHMKLGTFNLAHMKKYNYFNNLTFFFEGTKSYDILNQLAYT